MVTDTDAPTPQAIAAERAVLCAMLRHGHAVTAARAVLTVGDFWQPRHQVVFSTILELADAGRTVDPTVVLTSLTQAGLVPRVVDAAYLSTVFGQPAVPENIGWYAQQIRHATRRRQLHAIATRIDQIATDIEDPDAMLQTAASELIALQLVVDEPDPTAAVTGVSTWDEFLSRPVAANSWIVPNLIERQDVFMILAPPGAGKSWLSRQLCLAIAAGVHPFKPDERIEPARTLLIDLENPPAMVQRQSHAPASQVARLGDWDSGRAHIWARPEGIDLRKHADAQMLERVVADTRPAFLALGSLYKAYQRGRDDWDTAAEETRAVFDRIRARYGCAIWLEHHMPKASEGGSRPNPFGSSVWERWPGYGRVLRRAGESQYYELAATFRGDRDVREIPAGLYRGGVLPWSPIYDPDELRLLAEAST